MPNGSVGTEGGVDEGRRLEALTELRILDTQSEPDYDHIVELAALSCDAPIAAISLIDRERVWFKACRGFDEPWVPRGISFCRLVLDDRAPVTVCDAHRDARFIGNPFVEMEDGPCFYVGVPLVWRSGEIVGTLCVLDRQPRPAPDDRAMEMLCGLARLVVDRLEARRIDFDQRMALALAQASSDGIICTDVEGLVTSWNAAATRIFGYEAAEMIGGKLDRIVPERFGPPHRDKMQSVARRPERGILGRPTELFGRHRDGHEVPIELVVSVWQDGSEVSFGATIRDISERRRSQERMHWLAHNDSLTHLPNRASLNEDLAEMFASIASGGRAAFSVALLDLDGFKDVNDTLGHSTGDQLLTLVARRLVETIGDDGRVFRLGGDEFAVILRFVADADRAIEILARAQHAVSLPYEIDGSSIGIEVSIGVALAPYDGDNAEDAVSNADLALYRAKRNRVGRPRRYSPDLREEATLRRTLEAELRLALANGEFELLWQPQIDYTDGHWSGAEALLHWRHPSRGQIGPEVFMETLEASALASGIGSWMIEAACLQAATWRREGLVLDRIAINLFNAQLRHPNLPEEVAQVLVKAGLPAASLEFEIAEKKALGHDETLFHTLQGLHDLGVKIAFDDFGTGYASLSALKRYPIDRLKIDRSFVCDLPLDESDAAIVESIIAMARALGVAVVAEGVETTVQRDHLMARGCLVAQGPLHGSAMSAQQLARLVRGGAASVRNHADGGIRAQGGRA